MIGLFRNSTDGGTVSSAELSDLRSIVAGSNMPVDVKCLAEDVIAARPTASTMVSLLDKWFYGKDRPSIGGYANVSYQHVNGSLFVNGAESSDIKQGQIGNCYLLAGLGALADKFNSVINTMFKDNMDGTWSVRFYKLDGTRYIEDYVTVDRHLPVNSAGRAVFEDFGGTASSPRNELWASLAEKAYAQWARNNSYRNLSGGWPHVVLGELTGFKATSNFDVNNSTDELVSAVNRNDPVVIYRYMDAARTRGHAYYVRSYSNGLFYLQNPWGYDHVTMDINAIKRECYGFAVATRRRV